MLRKAICNEWIQFSSQYVFFISARREWYYNSSLVGSIYLLRKKEEHPYPTVTPNQKKRC